MWKGLMMVLVSVVIACNKPAYQRHLPGDDDDDEPDAAVACNVLLQTGCNVGQKCGWFDDVETPIPIGHIGCAPDGAVPIGGACAFGPDGPQGYSNCVRGSECANGTCHQICDLDDGDPRCASGFSCGTQTDLFDNLGVSFAGVCGPSCDPLADNYFGSGSDGFPPKTGSACGPTEECSGFPGTTSPTTATCKPAGNPALVEGSTCSPTSDCSSHGDGCAPGYLPLLNDSTGSSVADCIAYCAPLDCWNDGGAVTCGRTAAQTPTGVADGEALRGAYPHDCSNSSARGTFDLAVAGANNGVQCYFSWGFERDANGNHIPSPTSDTLGYCIDHSHYKYDSNDNGMIDGSDAAWPSCDTLGIGSNVDRGYDATYFGCVSTTTATAHGNPPSAPHRARMDLPRAPYHAVVRAR